MSEYIVDSNAEKFEDDVLKCPLPVAVNFYSDECPPCEAVAQIFERLAEKYRDQLKFVQIFRGENRQLAEKLGIKSSPAILFYKNGQEVCQRLTGYIIKPELRKAVEDTIGGTCKTSERKRYDCDAIVVGAGQASMTHHVANYPGTHGVIKGKELTGNMVEQAMSFGADIHDLQEISEIDLQINPKYIKTGDADYYAPCIVLATGAEPRKLPAEGGTAILL